MGVDKTPDPCPPRPRAMVFAGCLVHSTADSDMQVLEDSIIGVDEGKILFVDDVITLSRRLKEFGIPVTNVTKLTSSQFLMPGFVDCHAHASQFSFMGTGSDLSLLPWLHKYTFVTEARFKEDHAFARDVYGKCVNRTLRCGTTTISYYCTIDRKSSMILVDELEKQGQRAFVGKVNMDMNSPGYYCEQSSESVQETKKFIEDCLERKSDLVTPCVTPRFALACSMPLMRQLADMAALHDLPIQTHISENDDEIKGVRKAHAECCSYTDVYQSAGLLTSRTMLAHAVHLSDRELDVVKQLDCGICHCPNSNFSLSSGVMDLRRVLQAGVKVGLGTDFGAGHSPSMLDACKRAMSAANVHEERMRSGGLPVEVVTYKDMFRLATLGSCQVMGLDNITGNFEVGKEFDAILVDVTTSGSPIDVFPSDATEDLIQKFIFLGDDRNILKVFVQGREVISAADT